MEGEKGKVKVSSMGSSKRQNKMHWERYKFVLEGGIDTATNRGMRMNGGVMCTYQQKNAGAERLLRQTLGATRRTQPVEYHL